MATCKLQKGDVPMDNDISDVSIIGNRTFSALECLYLNSQEIQKKDTCRELRRTAPLAHAKEYGTVKICTARQSGHTFAISRFVNSCEYRKNWMILGSSSSQVEQNFRSIVNFSTLLKRKLQSVKSNCISYEDGQVIRFGSIKNFNSCLRGVDINGIIIDCASLWSKEKIEELYTIGLPCMLYQKTISFIFVE